MAISFVHIQGLKQVRDKLSRFTSTIEEAPVDILLHEARQIELEAKNEVPVDTHKLQDSIRSTVTRTMKTRVNLTVSASATNERNNYDYSKIQHDNEAYHHDAGRKANYLRDPFTRGVDRIESRIKQEVRYGRSGG